MQNKCPCGLKNDFQECCGRFINNIDIPQTAEQLMRSRYSAYSMANVDYIEQTMRGRALEGFDKVNAKQWALTVDWQNLNVIQSHPDKNNTNIAYVEFIASYLHNQQLEKIHELSCFEKINDRWYYVDGEKPKTLHKNKVGRNESCPCGSGKKYKKCCGFN